MKRLLMWKCAIGLLVLFAGSANAGAQTVTDERVWVTFIATGPIGGASSKWRISLESFFRSREGVDRLDSAAVRPVLIYNFDKHSSIGGGYAIAPSFPASGGATIEHRWFEQYIWTGAASGGTLSMRARIEQRFIEGNSGVDHRLREYVRYAHPIKKDSKTQIVGYDEIFVHLNTTTRTPRGFEQNRAFAGLQRIVSPTLRLEGGYLNQFVPGHGLSDHMNHVASATILVLF